MTPTEQEAWFEAAFDRALQARHDGKLDEALALGAEALAGAPEHKPGLRAAMHGEMSYIYRSLLDDAVRAEPHALEATRLSPKPELASLGLFHTLVDLDRWDDALAEMLRFVKLRDSEAYRDLLGEGFRDELPPERRAVVEETRRWLRFYRAGVW